MGDNGGGRSGHAYQQLRPVILHRDGPTCWLCGRTCRTTGNPNSESYATIDHVVPLNHAHNVEHRRRLLLDPGNCRIACKHCNSSRGDQVTTTNPLPGW